MKKVAYVSILLAIAIGVIIQIDAVSQACSDPIDGNMIVGGALCVPNGEGEGEGEAGVYIGGATEGGDGISLVKAPESSTVNADPAITLKGDSPLLRLWGDKGSIMFGDYGETTGSSIVGGFGGALGLEGLDADDFYTVIGADQGPIIGLAAGATFALGIIRDENGNEICGGPALTSSDGEGNMTSALFLSQQVVGEGEGENVGETRIRIHRASDSVNPAADFILRGEAVDNGIKGKIELTATDRSDAQHITSASIIVDGSGDVVIQLGPAPAP